MTKKNKRSITVNTPTGPITHMQGITVTPEGNGIGLPAESFEMVPERADLSDEQRHQLEARRGALAVNAGRALVAPVIATGLMTGLGAAPGAALGFGVGGLGSQIVNGNYQQLYRDARNPNMSELDKFKRAAPTLLTGGLSALGIYGGAVEGLSLLSQVSPTVAAARVARAIDSSNPSVVVREPVVVKAPLYEPVIGATNEGWILIGNKSNGYEIQAPILRKPYKPTVVPEDLAGNTRIRKALLLKKALDTPEIGRDAVAVVHNDGEPLSSLGVQYGDIEQSDINVPDDYVTSDAFDDRFGGRSGYYDKGAAYVWDNYRKAMTRKRSYLSDTPFWKMRRGKADGVRYNNSVILGETKTLSDGSTFFTPKHFAPANLREGLTLINKLGQGDQPVVFAVTPDLEKMLSKTGDWFYAGLIPLPFDGHIVWKRVMVNRAFKPEMIDVIGADKGLNLNYLKDQLIKSRGLKTDLSPTMTPLSELLTEEDLIKLKNSIK